MTRLSLMNHPLFGMLTESVSAGAIYPVTGTHFTALTGLTATSLYVFDEASGNLDDKIATHDLTAAGTPTFAHIVQGRRGIHYDAAADGHAANVHDLADASGIYTTVFSEVSDVGTAGIMGRVNATLAEGVSIEIATGANDLRYLVRDSGVNSTITTTTGQNFRDGRLTLVSLQIDRANTTARLRASYNGGAVTATSSIAGFATVAGASQTFGFGAYGAGVRTGGAANFWAAVITGAQCEGANVLQNLHRALGWA